MSFEESSKICAHCDRKVLVRRDNPWISGLLGAFLLAVLIYPFVGFILFAMEVPVIVSATAPFVIFVVVWYLASRPKPWRCTVCGTKCA